MHTDHHHEAQTDELEATELSSVVPGAEHLGFGADHSPEDAAHSSATAHCYDQSDVQAQQQHQRQQYWYDGIRRLWKHYVQLSVPRVDCRDHLGRSLVNLALFVSHQAVHGSTFCKVRNRVIMPVALMNQKPW